MGQKRAMYQTARLRPPTYFVTCVGWFMVVPGKCSRGCTCRRVMQAMGRRPWPCQPRFGSPAANERSGYVYQPIVPQRTPSPRPECAVGHHDGGRTQSRDASRVLSAWA